MTDIDKQYRELAATKLPNSDDYVIGDSAVVSEGQYGAWVQCWVHVFIHDDDLPKALLSKCDNCGDLTATHKLEHVPDLTAQLLDANGIRCLAPSGHCLDSGGIVPNGHCPECGALCYPAA